MRGGDRDRMMVSQWRLPGHKSLLITLHARPIVPPLVNAYTDNGKRRNALSLSGPLAAMFVARRCLGRRVWRAARQTTHRKRTATLSTHP